MSSRDTEDAIATLISIKDRDPNTMTKEDYRDRNALKQYLFDTVSIHDAFANKHPEFCFKTVLWMESFGPMSKLVPDRGKLYTTNGQVGGSIRVHPQRNNLVLCLEDAATEPNGLYLYFEEHSNILWFDPIEKVIHRYDPQIPGTDQETPAVDGAIAAFFREQLSSYRYLGNTLRKDQCIQDVRLKKRGHLDCFCQEYTLMYAYNRLAGMNHEEAAEDLVGSVDDIAEKVRDFYREMAI